MRSLRASYGPGALAVANANGRQVTADRPDCWICGGPSIPDDLTFGRARGWSHSSCHTAALEAERIRPAMEAAINQKGEA